MKNMMIIIMIPSSGASLLKRTMAAQVKKAFRKAIKSQRRTLPTYFNVITLSKNEKRMDEPDHFSDVSSILGI